MSTLFVVAAGGALGAVARYLVMSGAGRVLGMDFPSGTLIVNVVGSLILGGLVEVLALTWSPSQEVRAFLVVGLLGAFTTFSTFSLDVVVLIERGALAQTALYVVASIVLSVGAFFTAMAVMRVVLT